MLLGRLERIYTLCRKAAELAGVSPNDVELELLAKRMNLALNVLKSPFADLDELTSMVSWPLSNAAAQRCAISCRNILVGNDVEPLFAIQQVLAENLNVFVLVVDSDLIVSGRASIEGAAFLFVGRKGYERLFRCAAELGMLVVDYIRKDAQPSVVLNRRADCGDVPSRRSRGPRESFAECFAETLLLPANGAAVALQEIRRLHRIDSEALGDVELLYLSRIFGIKFRNAARRCERLDLLPAGGAVALENYLRDKFQSAEARAASLDLPERPEVEIDSVPTVLIEAAVRAVRNDTMSMDNVLEALGSSALARVRQG